jgi:hypothetical protein
MSRVTDQERVKSPAKYTIRFKGDAGEWAYWDKERGELGEEVKLESLDFVVLDMVSSISGWSDENQSSIYSSFFKTTKEEVVVRVGGGKEIFTGSYSNESDKARIKELGGKFTSNVFALAMIDGEYVPVRIDLTGGGIWNWTEFLSEHGRTNVYKYIVTGLKGEQQKKGSVKFHSPVFSFVEADDGLCSQADEFTTNELEPYISQ